MKKVLCLIILSTSIYVWGCKREANRVQPNKKQTDEMVIKAAEILAKAHNEGLDYFHAELMKTLKNPYARTVLLPPANPPVLTPGFPVLDGTSFHTITFNFIRQRFSEVVDSFSTVASNVYADSMFTIYPHLYHDDLYNISDYTEHALGYTMSPQLKTAMNLFMDYLATPVDTNQMQLDKFYWMANYRDNLTDTYEKLMFTSAFEIALESNKYWHRAGNMEKWEDAAIALDNYYSSQGRKVDVSAFAFHDPNKAWGVMKRDLMGAVVGVVRGAVVGGAGGTIAVPGVGTITGAAAGGLYGMVSQSVTSSAVAWVMPQLTKWIGWMQIPMPGTLKIRARTDLGDTTMMLQIPETPKAVFDTIPLWQ